MNEAEKNAWCSLNAWLDNKANHNPEFNKLREEVSQQLYSDQCYSAWVHIAELITKLSDLVEEQKAEIAYMENH